VTHSVVLDQGSHCTDLRLLYNYQIKALMTVQLVYKTKTSMLFLNYL